MFGEHGKKMCKKRIFWMVMKALTNISGPSNQLYIIFHKVSSHLLLV
jgi:hypothetical protein